MYSMDQEGFEKLVAAAIDHIPERYAKAMDNVAFVIEDYPAEEQRRKLHLHRGATLYGLYEGIPLTRRNAGYSMVLPDKITIFKGPIESVSTNLEQVADQVNRTVWHEVAHHFGLDHERIDELERDG